MRKLFPLAAALVAAVLIQASPAFGHPPVECTGEMTGTIEGDLVVPSGATCVLTDAHVTGDVTVESSARLDALRTRIEGDIDCSGGPSSEELWCDLLTGTVVEGNGIARAGGELHLHGGHILGNVRAGPDSVFQSSPVAGLFEERGFVGGNVRCNGCIFVDLVQTTVEGNVRIRGERDGSFIAEGSEIFGNLRIARSAAGDFSFSVVGTTIHGNFRFERNTGPTEIRDNVIGGNLLLIRNDVAGAFCPPDAPAEECPLFENGHVTGNQVGGNVRLIGNEGPIEVADNRIEGDLRCARNDPPPTGGGNVASRKTGQCSGL